MRYIKILLIAAATFLNCQGIANNLAISPKVLENAKKAIVTIEARISVSAYSGLGNWTGTGFIVDKTNGLIVTNAHVVSRASIGTYFVTFDNGKEAEAKMLYYDAWQDQAILKVNASDIPPTSSEIAFSNEEPKINQSVFIIGNNEGKEFSVHHGTISSIYDINGDMPQHSYIVNLNTYGGSSGSPLMNTKGQAIGLNYGGGETFALVLNGKYVNRIISLIREGKPIVRNHIGVITTLYSLDKAVKHRNFPYNEMEQYLKNFPDTRNKIMAVDYTITNSPASEFLKSGDIVWAINDVVVGADLYKFDSIMDSNKEEIKLTIYRDGNKIDFNIKLYNIENNKVKRMLNFGGATFFESDDFTSSKSGLPMGSLCFANVQTGSSFSSIPLNFSYNDRSFYRIALKSMGGYKTQNLDDLISVIPGLIKKKFIFMEFKNYLPYYQQFGKILISDHADVSADIILDSIDTEARLLEYSQEKMEWILQKPNE